MERHGADIQIESFKNRGSTFSFQLPVARLHQ
jgi:signal transduction histidine kinase